MAVLVLEEQLFLFFYLRVENRIALEELPVVVQDAVAGQEDQDALRNFLDGFEKQVAKAPDCFSVVSSLVVQKNFLAVVELVETVHFDHHELLPPDVEVGHRGELRLKPAAQLLFHVLEGRERSRGENDRLRTHRDDVVKLDGAVQADKKKSLRVADVDFESVEHSDVHPKVLAKLEVYSHELLEDRL